MDIPSNTTLPTEAGIEIGVITLGEFLKDPIQGQKISQSQEIE